MYSGPQVRTYLDPIPDPNTLNLTCLDADPDPNLSWNKKYVPGPLYSGTSDLQYLHIHLHCWLVPTPLNHERVCHPTHPIVIL